MATLHYYRHHTAAQKISPVETIFLLGWDALYEHKLLRHLSGDIYPKQKYVYDKNSAASVDFKGNTYVNMHCRLTADGWFYTLAHCLLHLAFGHFHKTNIPKSIYNNNDTNIRLALWNKACDIYITRFLMDIQVGSPTCNDPAKIYNIKLNSESKIYEHLLYLHETGELPLIPIWI